MNAMQIQLEQLKRAASAARFEPSGKPFKKACDLIEKLERALRSISQLAPRQEYDEIMTICEEALGVD
jgi:hypothetical protein